MKEPKKLFVILAALGVVVQFSCQKHDFQNPVDPDVALSAPDHVRVTKQSETLIVLAWDDHNHNENFPNASSAFEIEKSTDGMHFSQAAVTESDVKTVELNADFSTDSTYSFRIRTAEGTNKSAYSVPVPVKIDFPAPSNVVVTMFSESAVALQWHDNSSFETGFEIEQSTDGSAYALVASAAANETTKTIVSSYNANTTYFFRVKARSAKNLSAPSVVIPTSLLQSPAMVSVTQVTETSASVTWTDNSTTESGFQIELSRDGGTYALEKETPANTTNAIVQGLQPLGSSYSFRVRAKSTGNISKPSAAQSIALAVDPPSNISCTAFSAGSITLQWQDNSGFESGFDIEQSVDGLNYTLLGSVGPNVTHAVLNNSFIPFKKYSFRVRAKTAYNTSAYSVIDGVIMNNMIPVASGTFTAGSTLVSISSFNIDMYEVTYEMWNDIRTWGNANGYNLPAGQNGYTPVGSNNPVSNITWYDAVIWCNARSEKDGLTPVYYTDSQQSAVYRSGQIDINGSAVKWTANGYRLPTEAEWEYAGKGGKQSQGYKFSGSSTIDGVAWYDQNSASATHTVGQRAANELGIYDMSGNVWEWCWDWSSNAFPAGGTTDPKGPSAPSSISRLMRGGNYASSSGACWTNYRISNDPGYPDAGLGFRCVKN
jgi:formylglycine-generating enzyme required for sulfatase activity